MNLREAAKQALEALETEPGSFADWLRTMRAARTALRDALYEDAMQRFTDVQQQIERHADTSKTSDHLPGVRKMVATSQESRQVEPVAWITPGQDLHLVNHEGFQDWTPLYTAPPQHAQTWTDEHWTEYERGIVSTERERIAAWVEDMCAGLDAKTIANGIRNNGNDDIRAFEVRK